MNTTRASCVVRGALLLLFAGSAAAQTLEQRVSRAPDGIVRFSYAARPGTYGNGRDMISWGCRDGSCRHRQVDGWDRDRDDWESPCDSGPVRVALTKRGVAVTDLRVYVGGQWRSTSATDLGTVGTREAAHYLLSVAKQDASRAADKAIFAAILADSVTLWPELLRIAKQENVSRKVRRSAVFWLGQAAGDAATKGLTDLVDDRGASRSARDGGVRLVPASQRGRRSGVDPYRAAKPGPRAAPQSDFLARPVG